MRFTTSCVGASVTSGARSLLTRRSVIVAAGPTRIFWFGHRRVTPGTGLSLTKVPLLAAEVLDDRVVEVEREPGVMAGQFRVGDMDDAAGLASDGVFARLENVTRDLRAVACAENIGVGNFNVSPPLRTLVTADFAGDKREAPGSPRRDEPRGGQWPFGRIMHSCRMPETALKIRRGCDSRCRKQNPGTCDHG
jgi:hypothetical protein